MAHARAKLTPIGRAALVEPVLVHGWPVARAAEAMSVSRATAHKWIRRFHDEGPAGLLDRTSRPRRCPHALPPHQVRRITGIEVQEDHVCAACVAGWIASKLCRLRDDARVQGLDSLRGHDRGAGTLLTPPLDPSDGPAWSCRFEVT